MIYLSGAEGKQLIFKRIIHNCGLGEWGEMKSFYITDKKRYEMILKTCKLRRLAILSQCTPLGVCNPETFGKYLISLMFHWNISYFYYVTGIGIWMVNKPVLPRVIFAGYVLGETYTI